MSILSKLKDISRKKTKVQRIGRGPGTGRGKTSCRGHKGQGSRSGSKRRYGYEGGQTRLITKTPIKGFTRGRFIKKSCSINLSEIDRMFSDGDTVSLKTLIEKGYASRLTPGGLKILSKGNISKKVTIEAHNLSNAAKQKLEENKISYKIIKK